MEKLKKVNEWIDKNQTMIILSIIFISMLILNILTPYIADDMNYQKIWGTSDKVQNIWDIFVSQYNHYFSWGGRSIAHTIAQFFLMFPKLVFNVANSFCYIGIIYKINSIATDKKKNAWMLLLIHFILFLMVPYFGEDFLWLIGACNYAWTIWLMLIFLDIYKKNKMEDSKFTIPGMFLFGIVSGWTNENTGFALVAITFLYLMVEKIIEKKELKKWQISGLIGSFLGFIILLAAPGNYVRSSGLADNTFFIIKYLRKFISVTSDAVDYLWPLLLGFLVLYTYYIYKKKNPEYTNFIFLIGASISLYAMIVPPIFPERAWVGIIIYLVIAFINLLYKVVEKEKVVRFIVADFVIVLAVFVIRNYYRIASELNAYNHVIHEREEYIKENPNQEIYYFDYFKIDDKYSPIHGEDLTEDKDNWVNKSQALRYGVPYIIGTGF